MLSQSNLRGAIHVCVVKRIPLALAFAILLFAFPAFAADKGVSLTGLNRVALIIGNSAYAVGPLRNPVNDARTMARTLQLVGFRTTVLENADKRQIVTAVKSFGRELRQADVALFYFSGHGLQHNNHNWMVPIGAEIDKEVDLEFEGVNAERVLAELEGGTRNRVNIVIMDACRVNQTWRSFRAAKNGLANPGRSPTGSLIAFSTAPGKVAWDGEGSTSPYVEELSRHILTPGLSVEQVFKRARVGVMRKTAHLKHQQVPWENSSLVGDFYFLPGSSPTVNITPTQQTASLELSAQAWALIEKSEDPKVHQTFINKFPDSSQKQLAELKLMMLAPSTTTSTTSQTTEQTQTSQTTEQTQTSPQNQQTAIESESSDVWSQSIPRIKFIRIQRGSFWMGSHYSEVDRGDDEKLHKVQIDEFYLAETEVTQLLWKAITGFNPSRFKGDYLPVENVNWFEIRAFIKKFNRLTGKKLRLPTEAEWEYAARAGTQTARYWGEKIGSNKANCDGCGSGWDGKETSPVKSFTPNSFGLYDMLGNVSEWTCSEFKTHYDGSEKRCASVADSFSSRGGSWYDSLWAVRSAFRNPLKPTFRANEYGFRLAHD